MQGLGEELGIELADLLRDRFHHVHRGVALHPVMVAFVFVLFLKFLVERLDGRLWRIDSQPDVRDRAVGRIAGKLDDLLSGQCGLADDGLIVALLFELAKRTR